MTPAARPSRALRRIAYEEAAGALLTACSRIDLPPSLTPADEECVREFIRDRIVSDLLAKAAPTPPKSKEPTT